MKPKHGAKSRTGVLLINLGTPSELSLSAVRTYLNQFLSDPRVLDLPYPIRQILLKGVIQPIRSPKTYRAYQSIWTDRGSPLLFHSRDLAEALQTALGEAEYAVALGMRYGEPSLAEGVASLLEAGCHTLHVIPLYPQYASATTGSSLERLFKILQSLWNLPSLVIQPPFYEEEGFIRAFAARIQAHQTQYPADFTLFSYHGLPERHLRKSGCQRLATCQAQINCTPQQPNNPAYCYRAQCFVTSAKLIQALSLNPQHTATTFQSRLGKTPWITPYTDAYLATLRQQGVQTLNVVCPSFVADCLETLEEIEIKAQHQWRQLGGRRLSLVPSLNAHPLWVAVLAEWVKKKFYAMCDFQIK